MTQQKKLQSGLNALGLNLSHQQEQQLLAYIALLQKWNKTYNLTALRGEGQMISHHIIDSLTLLPFIQDAQSLIDVGSGGGMPGIPTAIARPDLAITLMDANTKKTSFLQQAIIELGLNNVEVVTGRVEALHDKKADVITSRAFAELADFITLTKHLLKPQGYWAAMKGVYPFEEIEHLPANIALIGVEKIQVPLLNAERHMVLMRPSA